MFPSSLPAVMQKMDQAEVERGMQAARHRAALPAARRDRSRSPFAWARTRRSGLRTDSQVNLRPV
jgi:hypothetical protein